MGLVDDSRLVGGVAGLLLVGDRRRRDLACEALRGCLRHPGRTPGRLLGASFLRLVAHGGEPRDHGLGLPLVGVAQQDRERRVLRQERQQLGGRDQGAERLALRLGKMGDPRLEPGRLIAQQRIDPCEHLPVAAPRGQRSGACLLGVWRCDRLQLVVALRSSLDDPGDQLGVSSDLEELLLHLARVGR